MSSESYKLRNEYRNFMNFYISPIPNRHGRLFDNGASTKIHIAKEELNMAERRMFAKTIVLSDAFLDMPLSARCLYFTLGMLADDDGFVNSPKSIMRQCGASQDDMKILLAKKFLISFDTGVIVIKHWKINNYLRNDRYKETKFIEEKKKLAIKENGSYSVVGIPVGIPSIGKVSIGKDSIEHVIVVDQNVEEEQQQPQQQTDYIKLDGPEEPEEPKEDKPKKTKFKKPTIEEIKQYCIERKNKINAEHFFDYYESKGWIVGKTSMKDWKAAIRTWERQKFNQAEEKKEGEKNGQSNISRYDKSVGWCR